MKFLRRDALWIYVLIICLAFPLATSLKCDGKTQKLVAKTMAQSIRSPGHPNNYEANDECTYIIHTELPSEEYMMQISVMELALSDPKGDCSDYLEIYEGDKASGTLLERLCGESGGEFKSHSSTVTLYFKSDDSFEDKGYTVFYQMVKYASHLCMEKADNPIIIGLEPMYKAFHGSNTLPK
ncbi:hypothetical protein EGW08_022733 [Elysia chlorotica]|uniref:CUB domain-containing protein n=1 Tax=Elysia chlorotica TaxID=188477 RepID=A0A433SK62_ELYCH|nr:hypothetical protein EGW08_022733 [Elysia chlorotica]